MRVREIPFEFKLTKMYQGADIDIRVVRDGRGPDCNVWSNFKQVNMFYKFLELKDTNVPPKE